MSTKQKPLPAQGVEQETKEASSISPAAHVAGTMLGLLGVSTISGGLGYLLAKNQYDRHMGALRDSYDNLKSSESYGEDPSSFSNRFSELSLISPTVASNPILAHKIIKPRLKDGFTLDDIHRLSSVEYHTSQISRVPDPVHFGLGRASSAFTSGLQSIVPVLGSQVSEINARNQQLKRMEAVNRHTSQQASQQAKSLDAINKERAQLREEHLRKFRETLSKKLSPQEVDIMTQKLLQMGEEASGGEIKKMGEELNAAVMDGARVSDECLGRMIADRYVMYKTAANGGVLNSLSKVYKNMGLGKGVEAVKEHFQYVAPALILGGGIQLLREAMKKSENDKLRAQADQVFAQLKKNSDYIQQNPAMAAEAFDALKSFAPSVAVKPLVAKSFVEGVVKAEHMGVDTASMLAQTEQRIRDNGGQGQGFLEGLKTPMSLFSMRVGKQKD